MEALKDWFSYVQNNQEGIIEETLTHARMTLIVVALASVFAVLVGVAIQRNAVARPLVLSTAGVFLTIPSLAFFALFVPITGTGNLPAMCALFLYALLPIIRNTVTGLDAVNPAVVESAKGMGLNARQQLVQVRLPLAWPVIMTGIRVATLLTVSIAAIAPLVGGNGLGNFVKAGLTRNGFDGASDAVWVGVVFTILLGLVLDALLGLFQRFTTPRGLRV